MTSPVVTPKKKTCVMCHEEKGRTAFIKDGDLCTKCRNTETNPLCLKRGPPSTWSSTPPSSRRSDLPRDSESPNRSLSLNGSNSPTTSSSSRSPPIISSQSEEKSMCVISSIDTRIFEHKIDLILESTLEMERKQIQVASIRSEMHKFLVDLSHLNNVPSGEEQKYSGLDSLAVTIDQHFVSTRSSISALQGSISTLRGEIAGMIGQHSKAIEDTWRVETERREQIWQARVMEERRIWNERLMAERQQWQQCMQQQTFQLNQILQENMRQWRQEYHTLPRTESWSSEAAGLLGQPVINTNSSSVNTQGLNNASLSQPKSCDVRTISVGLSNLSTASSSPQSRAAPANPILRGSTNIKPPSIIIKRSVVKM
jgi:hypothetical protein